MYEKPKQESINRLQGNSAVSSEGRKKMPTRRSPGAKHGLASGVPPRNSFTETRIRSPWNNPCQNEVVIVTP